MLTDGLLISLGLNQAASKISNIQMSEHYGVVDAKDLRTDGNILQFHVREEEISVSAGELYVAYGCKTKNMATFRLYTKVDE